MCKILKVNRASYYHWVRAGCVVKKVDEKLNELVKNIFIGGRGNYGTRRIKSRLQQIHGVIVSKRRCGTIMRELGLVAKIKKRFVVKTTDSNHNLPIAPNILDRDFSSSVPGTKYVGDITYIEHCKVGYI